MDGTNQDVALQGVASQDHCSAAVTHAVSGIQLQQSGSGSGSRGLGCRFLFNNSDAGIIIGVRF